ncbi:CGG triplet repeat-binding protein 1 [Plakobranchus ocellatus]|uniref:CGG triplet repeat-binding protein 1 n=1 Tax=Plakobranchus ocellatus TaxID=259542 RepID=A0AAV4BM85_9GAST|nr:CGG triplet repeat-binding protein 1 [Plakobranchus ocellatus]
MTDEMSDDNGRFVLNILAAPMELQDGKVKTFLLDSVFLEATNHSTVAQAVVSCVADYGIAFDMVIAVNTDNASYMRKAYTAVFKGLFPNSVHITCLAHIMNLLGEAFKQPFKQVNQFIKNMNAIFWNAGARKYRFLHHLKSVKPSQKATMPPNPIGTRWICWYDSVKYHLDHMEECKYSNFIESEMEHARSLAPISLKELSQFFAVEENVQNVKAHMKFITEKSQSPMATSVWSMLKSIENAFNAGGVTMREMEKYCSEDTPMAQKIENTDIFNQAYSLVESKLRKYMAPEGQPGIEFLHHVQFFHPAKVIMVPPPNQLYGIPGLRLVPDQEIRRYMKDLGPAALKSSPTEAINIEHFWNSAFETVPNLVACARRYIYATVSSADAERSFSLYNIVLSERRRNLSESSLKQLVFLYYNNFVGKHFFE